MRNVFFDQNKNVTNVATTSGAAAIAGGGIIVAASGVTAATLEGASIAATVVFTGGLSLAIAGIVFACLAMYQYFQNVRAGGPGPAVDKINDSYLINDN